MIPTWARLADIRFSANTGSPLSPRPCPSVQAADLQHSDNPVHRAREAPGGQGPGCASGVWAVPLRPNQGSHLRRSGSGCLLQGCLKLFQLHPRYFKVRPNKHSHLKKEKQGHLKWRRKPFPCPMSGGCGHAFQRSGFALYTCARASSSAALSGGKAFCF